MLLDELRNRRAEISALGERYGAHRIRVFGSVARGEETARMPARAASGVSASQLNKRNSAHRTTCSPSSDEHVTR